MTNRDMVKPGAAGSGEGPRPNRDPLPPMPATEDSPTPTTDREPPDSPGPNASAKRGAPAGGKIGLTTDRTS